jgi:hypothetical protein
MVQFLAFKSETWELSDHDSVVWETELLTPGHDGIDYA